MRLQIGSHEVRADVGHLLFATILTGIIAVYGGSVFASSGRTADLIFIIPGAVAMVLLYGALLMQEIKVRRISPDEDSVKETAPEEAREERRILITQWVFVVFMVLFLMLVRWVGIEIATAVFTAASLWLLGSRNLWLNILLPVGFAAFISFFFVYLLSVPIDSAVFR